MKRQLYMQTRGDVSPLGHREERGAHRAHGSLQSSQLRRCGKTVAQHETNVVHKSIMPGTEQL